MRGIVGRSESRKVGCWEDGYERGGRVRKNVKNETKNEALEEDEKGVEIWRWTGIKRRRENRVRMGRKKATSIVPCGKAGKLDCENSGEASGERERERRQKKT